MAMPAFAMKSQQMTGDLWCAESSRYTCADLPAGVLTVSDPWPKRPHA